VKNMSTTNNEYQNGALHGKEEDPNNTHKK
jgi:hypothetical protein